MKYIITVYVKPWILFSLYLPVSTLFLSNKKSYYSYSDLKNPENQVIARAAITQITNLTFQRMEEYNV